MRIVLIGAGLAAQRCAETLRANGHDGPIVMVGAEPHAPYDRPPLSKAVLAGERPDVALRPASWHADHRIELRIHTTATALEDGRVQLDTGEALAYDRLLIATGARPVELPGLANAHTLRTLDDALELDRALGHTQRLAIVGAGLIGQEVASAATARGVHTTLIDASQTPFDALMGAGASQYLLRLHERAGVNLKLGRRLIAVHGTDTVEALDLDDGSRIPTDTVLVAVGVRPDTRWTPWPDGVPVDPAGRAPAPGVYAAGDAAAPYDPILRRPAPSAHWEAAARQGSAAARSMLGLPARAEAPPLVWSDQHGVRIQRVGDTRHAALHDVDDGVFTYVRHDQAAAVVLIDRPGSLAAARRRLKTPIKEAA